jgi:hypothetical protein
MTASAATASSRTRYRSESGGTATPVPAQTMQASRECYEAFAEVFEGMILDAAYGDGKLRKRSGYAPEPGRTGR